MKLKEARGSINISPVEAIMQKLIKMQVLILDPEYDEEDEVHLYYHISNKFDLEYEREALHMVVKDSTTNTWEAIQFREEYDPLEFNMTDKSKIDLFKRVPIPL
jgi:hypothetical protein